MKIRGPRKRVVLRWIVYEVKLLIFLEIVNGLNLGGTPEDGHDEARPRGQ